MNVVSCLGISTCIIILDSNCYGFGNGVRSSLGWMLYMFQFGNRGWEGFRMEGDCLG